MKICTKCHISKAETDYFVKQKGRNLLHSQCKACYAVHRKVHYAEHYKKYSEMYIERALKRNTVIKHALHAKLVTYLSTKSCEICTESDIRVLDFDHINPSEKSFNIARGISNGIMWERILEEIAKCRILCTNCHRKHTAYQQKWYKK